MKGPYEIPDHWNPAGSERGQKAGRLAAANAANRRKRGHPVGTGHPPIAPRSPTGPQPINKSALDPRFAEIDREIRAGRGDRRPKGVS